MAAPYPLQSRPQQPLPFVRARPPRPPRPREGSNSSNDAATSERQSGLRASVLESALEIGFASNSTVADWMFNNPLQEEEEEGEKPNVHVRENAKQAANPALASTSSSQSSLSSLPRKGSVSSLPRNGSLGSIRRKPPPSVNMISPGPKPQVPPELFSSGAFAMAPLPTKYTPNPKLQPIAATRPMININTTALALPVKASDTRPRPQITSVPLQSQTLLGTRQPALSQPQVRAAPAIRTAVIPGQVPSKGQDGSHTLTAAQPKSAPVSRPNYAPESGGVNLFDVTLASTRPLNTNARPQRRQGATDGGGYDSETPGFMSDGGKRGKTGKEKSRKKDENTAAARRERDPSPADTDLGFLSEPNNQKKTKRSKSPPDNSRKPSKSRSFFRRSTKAKSKSPAESPASPETKDDYRDEGPLVPPMPLPIAERFSRSATSSPVPQPSVASPPPPVVTRDSAEDQPNNRTSSSRSHESSLASSHTNARLPPQRERPKGGVMFDFHIDTVTDDGSVHTDGSGHSPGGAFPRDGSQPSPALSTGESSSSFVVVSPTNSSPILPQSPPSNPLRSFIKSALSPSSHAQTRGPYNISAPTNIIHHTHDTFARVYPSSSRPGTSSSLTSNNALLPPSSATRPLSPKRRSHLFTAPVDAENTDSPLTSPSRVLSQYDMPPPSPPPTAPLPKVPIQRGREQPFPQRSVVPPSMRSKTIPIDSGFEGRLRVPRYRDLYALPAQEPEPPRPQLHMPRPRPGSVELDRYAAEEEVRTREMDVDAFLAQMSEGQLPPEDDRGAPDYYAADEDDDDRSQYSDSENHGTMNGPSDSGGGGRPSLAYFEDEMEGTERYSTSGQTVNGFLDDQKSGAARERFVRRVQALSGEDGREILKQNEHVPPVPKLPEGLRFPGVGRGGHRF